MHFVLLFPGEKEVLELEAQNIVEEKFSVLGVQVREVSLGKQILRWETPASWPGSPLGFPRGRCFEGLVEGQMLRSGRRCVTSGVC